MTESSANFDQGASMSEQEGIAMWGAPPDVAHSRRSYMGGGEDLGYNTRQEPRMSDPALDAINPHGVSSSLAEGQFEHALWVQRGMPGKVDAPDGTPRASGRIKAVHQFGLGALVQRAADEGHDPGTDQVATDYLHQPEGPRPGVLDNYVDAARLLPAPTGYGNDYPLEHTGSHFECMGDDLIVAASRAVRRTQGQ